MVLNGMDGKLVSTINEIKMKLLFKGFERVDCRFDYVRSDLNVNIRKHIGSHLFSLEQVITSEMIINVPIDVIVDTIVNNYECLRKEKMYE